MGFKQNEETVMSKFPVKIKNTTLYFDRIIHEEDCNKHYIKVYDIDGYYYLIDSKRSINKDTSLCRFFHGNIYTKYNINHYLELNNFDIRLQDNIPISGGARDRLRFIKSNGEECFGIWNNIHRNKGTDQFKINADEIKQNKYDNLHMSKKQAVKIILELKKDLDRPLIASDFMGIKTTETTIGIRVIRRIWGTFTNMLEDLNIKPEYPYKPNDKNYKPHEYYINSIKEVCDYVKTQGRTILTQKDFVLYLGKFKKDTFEKHCKILGTTFKEQLEKHGCKLQKPGNGMVYNFEDGEQTLSYNEFRFSSYLRNNGLIYNKDYFRAVKYSDINPNYSGTNIDCDYKILYKDRIIYIEIGGIIGRRDLAIHFKNDTPISRSKSKERYRLKLKEKVNLLTSINADFYILFDDDIDDLYKITNNL